MFIDTYSTLRVTRRRDVGLSARIQWDHKLSKTLNIKGRAESNFS